MLEVKQMELTDYQDIKVEIKNSMGRVVVSFVEIGYYLKKIRDEKMYLTDGYKDVWEMAKAEYNLDRTTASRFMSINDRYSIGGNSIELQEQFRGFGKSALVEMLTLPVEDYELLSPDTKIEDIRELKEAEREQAEEEKDELKGQMSLINDMPDVVPEAEKPKKEEVTISDVIRELFHPREMKDYLDQLVNMDPESQSMEWWVNDFNQSGNRTFKKIPFFLFFYGKEEGMKLKNIKTGEIKSLSYKDFYFMVRAAFAKETASGTDVWNQAFGAEYEAELQRQKEEEQRQREEEKRKKELQKQKEEKQRQVKENQEKVASEEPENDVSEEKEAGNAAALKGNVGSEDLEEEKYKDTVNEAEENKDIVSEEEAIKEEVQEEPETEVEDKSTEVQSEGKAEVVEGEVENAVCDIAQSSNGYTITLPAAVGQRMYMVNRPVGDSKAYIGYIYPYMYEIRGEKNIKMYYRDELDNSFEISVSNMERLLIYADMERAEEEKNKLNGEEE